MNVVNAAMKTDVALKLILGINQVKIPLLKIKKCLDQCRPYFLFFFFLGYGSYVFHQSISQVKYKPFKRKRARESTCPKIVFLWTHRPKALAHCILLLSRNQRKWVLIVVLSLVEGLTGGSPVGRGWGWPWYTAWSPPRQGGSHSMHTLGSPRASICPGPSAGSGPWSSGCSRHSPLAWCPAGRKAFVYLPNRIRSEETDLRTQ